MKIIDKVEIRNETKNNVIIKGRMLWKDELDGTKTHVTLTVTDSYAGTIGTDKMIGPYDSYSLDTQIKHRVKQDGNSECGFEIWNDSNEYF